MKVRTGNLARLTGHVIILHGINGGWHHGPAFGAGFAADIACRDPGARASYEKALQYQNARGQVRPRNYASRFPALWTETRFPGPHRMKKTKNGDRIAPNLDAGGLPLGWVFPHRLTGGAILLHGVTQPYVKGTRPEVLRGGQVRLLEPDERPARLSAVRAVLDGAIRFMRELALREGTPRELHCTRLGCGLGGLAWAAVRERVEQAEADAARLPPHPALVLPDVLKRRQIPAEFTVWTRRVVR